MANSKESIVFEWDPKEIETFVYGKLTIEETIESIKLAHKARTELGFEPKILEAGSGNGCVVILFNKLGFSNISGIEKNPAIVQHLQKNYPGLKFLEGSITDIPLELLNNDIVLSLGVIEHFPDGLYNPLKCLYDALKPGGYTLISIPCLNTFRKINSIFDISERHTVKKFRRTYIGGGDITRILLMANFMNIIYQHDSLKML